MKVSIVTVCFNSEDTIRDTLRSIDLQDHSDLEHIIIDGASTDNTLKVISEFTLKYRKVISEPDEGLYDAMNKGVKEATGDVIGILNADDLLSGPWVISKIVKCLQEQEVDAVYGDLIYVDQKDVKKVKRTWKAGPYRSGAFKMGWMPPHPTFYLKRWCYEKFGGYRTELSSSADYELMLRMIHKEGVRVAYIPQDLVRMRVGGQSNISLWNRIKANLEDRKAWRMNGLKPGITTLWAKPLSKISQFFKR